MHPSLLCTITYIVFWHRCCTFVKSVLPFELWLMQLPRRAARVVGIGLQSQGTNMLKQSVSRQLFLQKAFSLSRHIKYWRCCVFGCQYINALLLWSCSYGWLFDLRAQKGFAPPMRNAYLNGNVSPQVGTVVSAQKSERNTRGLRVF